jgi:DMSO reductase anchor subunit
MATQYPLVFFTLLLCTSAGLIGFQGWLLIQGKGTNKFHQVLNLVELIAVVCGGFASFLHLHHWERIFNGFMHLSSGITQELIGVVVIILTIIVMFVALRKSAKGDLDEDQQAKLTGPGLTPKWVGIWALVVGLVMGFVCAHSYDMASKPAWNNVTLYLYYYSSEFLMGAVTTWLVAAACKQDDEVNVSLAKGSLIAGIVAAVVMVICGLYYGSIDFYHSGIVFHTTDPTAAALDSEGVLAGVMTGENALLFWGGSVLLGAVVAAVCGFCKVRKTTLSDLPLSVVAFLCSFAGGVCFRVILYVVAIDYWGYF